VGRWRGWCPLFLLVDLKALLTQLPLPAGREIPAVTPALKLLSLVQPTVLLSVAVLIGVALASKVGLWSPVAEAAAGGGHLGSALKPQVNPALIGGYLYWKKGLESAMIAHMLAHVVMLTAIFFGV
jgi:hypothetical protein